MQKRRLQESAKNGNKNLHLIRGEKVRFHHLQPSVTGLQEYILNR